MKISDLPPKTQEALAQGECRCVRRYGGERIGNKCSYCRALRLVRDLTTIEKGGSPGPYRRTCRVWRGVATRPGIHKTCRRVP